MLQTVSPLILKLSLFLMTAVATHLVMSFGQTLLHYKVAHHPIGGKLFLNHINFRRRCRRKTARQHRRSAIQLRRCRSYVRRLASIG